MARARRSASLIIIFLTLVVSGLLYGAHWILETAETQMRRDTEQNLKTAATQQVALLTVWYGGVTSQIKSIVDTDSLRLFASEVDSGQVNANELLAIVKPATEDTPRMLDEATEEALAGYVERLPGLQQLLNDFVLKNRFLSAYVLNRSFEPYLTTVQEIAFLDAWKERLAHVLEAGKPCVLPIRRQDRELVVDIAFPVFAPTYIDKRGNRVVAVFIATCSVQQAISAVDSIDAEGFFTSAVLEAQGDRLELIDPVLHLGRKELPEGWELKEGGLSLAVRNEPTRVDTIVPAYTLALPVADLPWYVMQGITVPLAESAYHRFRENVYIGVGLLCALAVILIAALWWWIVGRRERAIADQMRRLYMIANEQKQILDGVNTSLAAGIVLNDLDGKIYYVNQSYADMAKMAPERMFGMQYTQLPKELARSLVTHTIRMNEKPGLNNFTEVLPVAGLERHYLTACSPCVDETNSLTGMVSVYSDFTELFEAQERAQRMVHQTIQVLVRAVEAVDPYLCGQSESMSKLAQSLAARLQKDDEETISTLRIAASLSQIGMIQLPRSLLLKTGSLTPSERLRMQKHIEYTKAALEGVDFGLPVLETITQMYERMDGSGYPLHLSGDEICFSARILAVANTFCALMRPRSYRTAHTQESALAIFDITPYKYDREVTQALRDFLETDEGQLFLKTLMEREVEKSVLGEDFESDNVSSPQDVEEALSQLRKKVQTVRTAKSVAAQETGSVA